MRFVRSARCLVCGSGHPAGPLTQLCPSCGEGAAGDPGVLDVEYACDAAADPLRSALRSGERGVFRWAPLLPVEAPAAGLPPTGDTPLVPAPRLAARYGLGRLLLKDETRNPTRCLKDRATAVAVSRATAAGISELFCASAGNAAISLAGFTALLGLGCHVFVPHDASAVRLAWLERFGADVRVSRGDYDTAFAESEVAGREHGWYSRNCAYNPYLVEGKKTVAFEIAEQLGWRVPDVVVAPVGDGCTLAAVGKGFRELRETGLTDRLPCLLGVQAAGMQPLVRRFRGEPPAADSGETRAASVKVRHPRNAVRLLRELAASGGTLTAADDAAIGAAQRDLGREAGIAAEFTSAAGLAALASWAADRPDRGGLIAVVILTGGRDD